MSDSEIISVENPLHSFIQNFISYPFFIMEQLFKEEKANAQDAVLLYNFYLKKACIESRNSGKNEFKVYCQVKYCAEGLYMGRDRIRRARKILKKHGLINDIQHIGEGGKFDKKCFTKINFKISEGTIQKIFEQTTEDVQNEIAPDFESVSLIPDTPVLSEEMLKVITDLNEYFVTASPGKASRHKIPAPGEKINKTIQTIADNLSQLQSGEFLKNHVCDSEWMKKQGIKEISAAMTLESVRRIVKKAIKKLHTSMENHPGNGFPKSLHDFFYNFKTKKSMFLLFHYNESWLGDNSLLRQQKAKLEDDESEICEEYYENTFMKKFSGKSHQTIFFGAVNKLKEAYEKNSEDLSKLNQEMHMSFPVHCRRFSDFISRVFEFMESDWSYRKRGIFVWGKGDIWENFCVWMREEFNTSMRITEEDRDMIKTLSRARKNEEQQNKINERYQDLIGKYEDAGEDYTEEELWERARREVEKIA
jgi:hypothetical protein